MGKLGRFLANVLVDLGISQTDWAHLPEPLGQILLVLLITAVALLYWALIHKIVFFIVGSNRGNRLIRLSLSLLVAIALPVVVMALWDVAF